MQDKPTREDRPNAPPVTPELRKSDTSPVGPMPTDDPLALVEWGKRHIQK